MLLKKLRLIEPFFTIAAVLVAATYVFISPSMSSLFENKEKTEKISDLSSQLNFLDSQINVLNIEYDEINSDTSFRRFKIIENVSTKDLLLKKRMIVLDEIKELEHNKFSPIRVILIISLILLFILITFFLSSFKSSFEIFRKDEPERIKKGKDEGKENYDFINWLINEEIHNYNGELDIEKAKKYKELFDLASKYPEDKTLILQLAQDIIDLTRYDELQAVDEDSEVETIFEEIQYRLRAECGRLNKQAVLNLFLSFIIILSLVLFMGLSNFFFGIQQSYASFEDFLIGYLPKVVSIVSLLTVFFYFIRLYKTNILDVKYYQNELTNIELKQMALKLAIAKNDKETIEHLIKEVLKTERNQVLTKEQTTIDLERQKMENEISKNYLDKTWEMMSNFFNMKKER